MIVKYRPQEDFPYYTQACELLPIHSGVCFTYGDTYYTDHSPIPHDFLIHEMRHTKQQELIGKDEWWRRFFAEPKFRLEQELECYKVQLASIKDRNARFRRRMQVIDDLSGALYGNCVSKDELVQLLK